MYFNSDALAFVDGEFIKAEAAQVGLADPVVRDRHALLGMDIMAQGPADFAGFLAEQRIRIGALIRDNNIRLES